MHLLPRLRRVALTVPLAAAAVLAVPAPAAAEACRDGEGVTVVVDFASLGGGVVVRCAPGDPASALEALRTAGFAVERAAQEPGYFVCRINGKPANDPCQRASPADAYWSSWHGEPGGAWSYSTKGATARDPAPGSVEGWAFGAGNPPSAPPPASRPASAPPQSSPPRSSPAAQEPAPQEPVPQEPAPQQPTRESPALAAPPPASTDAAEQPTTPPATATVAPSADPTAPAPAPAVDRRDDEALARDEVAARGDDEDGSPLPAVLAGGVVLALSSAGAWHVRRRGSTQAGETP